MTRWTKTVERSDEYGACYESENGWTVEVILRAVDVSSTSRAVRYVVCHYLAIDPNGFETTTETLAEAKALASR